MRVIAGSARHLQLITPRGDSTRPTTDKSKETLFNCLMPYIGDAIFLDLFAGSGAIGIEALSRGAKCAVFVEQNREALECINKNLKFTKLIDGAQVHKGDVFTVLKMLEGRYCFDIIFMDPPFDKELEKSVFEILRTSSVLNDDTVIVAEISNDTEFDYLEELGFEVFKIKQYKNNRHIFCRRMEN